MKTTKPTRYTQDAEGSPQILVKLLKTNGEEDRTIVVPGKDGKSFRVVLDDVYHEIKEGETLEQAVRRQQAAWTRKVWADTPECWIDEELGFVDEFDGYACENDMIQCDHQGYHVVAKIERDEHHGIDDDDCHSVAQDVTGCNDEQFSWLMHCRSEWENNEWFYCGIVLSVFFNGVEIEEHAASLFGIECNYPQQDDNTDNSYLRTVANELLPEAIETAKKRHEELIQKLTKKA